MQQLLKSYHTVALFLDPSHEGLRKPVKRVPTFPKTIKLGESNLEAQAMKRYLNSHNLVLFLELSSAPSPAVHLHHLSQDAQKQRVLAHLRQYPATGLNRFEADQQLNICHLAGPINALRNEGYLIITRFETALDLNGRPHQRIGRYFLIDTRQHSMACLDQAA